MSFERRDFLKQSAFIITAASSSKWVMNALAADEKQVWEKPRGPGIETWKQSSCRLCPGGCGIKVRLVDGQPVKIEGNPISPINRGGLCPMGHSGLQVLYNPDRIKSPLKRVGSRGSGSWKPITWQEAIQTIAQKLTELRTQNRPHHFLFLHGEIRGLFRRLIQQFMEAYGSPNLISTRSGIYPTLSLSLMHGEDYHPAYDFANTRFILSFGNDLLGTEGPPTWMAKMFGQMRQNSSGYRVNLVQADSRFSMTAAKADKWLPIKPGTAGALALGIAYILIMEERYDKNYIKKFTFGFEDWKDANGDTHVGFKSLVRTEYYPEKVSQITGIPVNDIIQVARSFAENQPAIAIFGDEVQRHSNGLFSEMAIHALNALIGSLGRSGGIIEQPREILTAFPAAQLDSLAKWGRQQIRADQSEELPRFFPIDNVPQFVDNSLSGEPYAIEMAMIYNTNPIFELPDPQHTREALQKIPFLVSFSSFMDETAEIADLILPDHIYLEKWDLDYGVPYLPFEHAGLSQPIESPRFNTRHTGDVFVKLAHYLGGNISRSIPFKNYKELVVSEAKSLFKSGRGFIPSGGFEEYLFSYIMKRGFKYPKAKTFKEFWSQFKENGSWMEFPPRVSEIVPRFHTTTKKFEFYSLEIDRKIQSYIKTTKSSRKAEFAAKLDSYGLSPKEDKSRLPHFDEPIFIGEEPEYSLHLRPFQIVTMFNGEGANCPLLIEMVGYLNFVRWDSWAEISQATAEELGLKDRDWIWIESPSGKVKTRAKVSSTLMPGIIFVPLGLGHTSYGRYAQDKGINPNKIIPLQKNVLNGQILLNNVRVKIYPAIDA